MSCIYDDNALCDLILVEDGVFDFGGVSGETGLDLRGCPGGAGLSLKEQKHRWQPLPPAPICLTSSTLQCVEQC